MTHEHAVYNSHMMFDTYINNTSIQLCPFCFETTNILWPITAAGQLIV